MLCEVALALWTIYSLKVHFSIHYEMNVKRQLLIYEKNVNNISGGLLPFNAAY